MTSITPKNISDGMRALREQGLPAARPVLRHTPGLEQRLSDLLRQAETLALDPVTFHLSADGRFIVNGVLVPHKGRGLLVAWLVLAGIKYREPPLHASEMFPGPSWRAGYRQALDRAAEAVKPISPNLANVFNAMGLDRGRLVLTENPQVSVDCTMDARLIDVFQRST